MTGPRLSVIPAGAVTDRTLEPRDLQVLCLLGRHTDKAGWCVRSQVKMAAEIDCSRGSLQNSLDRLCSAGWVEKKRRDLDVEEAGKQPSRSYAYRVVLDRDDYLIESALEGVAEDDPIEAPESHAETASEEGGCQPVGTPVPTQEQHGGANACVGTRANVCDGTMNAPLERPSSERERDARARDRESRGLVDFEARWPTAAADDRQRTVYAWSELADDEREAATGGIAPFLENLKRLGRKGVPAGWKYLEEKRWTLLADTTKTEPAAFAPLPPNSDEAKAVQVVYTLAGKASALQGYMRLRDRSLAYLHEITPRLKALALAPPQAEWAVLSRQQARAWSELIDAYVAIATRKHLSEGDHAPWPWPPSKDGKIYAGTGPPDGNCTDEDLAEFAKTG